MDDREGDPGEEDKSGVHAEGFEEDEEDNREGNRGSRTMRKERKEMELASFGSSPVDAVRRFLVGELVEVVAILQHLVVFVAFSLAMVFLRCSRSSSCWC
jgi:hypothetical protein